MSKIKVSVILPSFNSVKYIDECIDSVRKQTLSEIEIICVDSGSTDGTYEILQKHSNCDSRIRVIYSEKKSYGYQVNLGVKAAKGEYIGIVETDDYVAENMYEKLYQNAHKKQLDFIKADYYFFIDLCGKRFYERQHFSVNGNYKKVICLRECPEAILYGNHCYIWAGIYRREFLLKKQIFCNESQGASYQDTGFAILCALSAKNCMFLNEPLYRYRRDNSDSSVHSQEKYAAVIEEFRWIKTQMLQRGFFDNISMAAYMIFKFDAYLWNYNRLTGFYRKKFIEKLKQEYIDVFDEKLLNYEIPQKEKILNLCNGIIEEEDNVQYVNRYAENVRNIFHILCSNKKVAIVSAGNWGKSILGFANKIMPDCIHAVYDNAKEKYGLKVEGYTVQKVSSIKKDSETFFIIANKRNAEELTNQLEMMGIERKKIYISTNRLDWESNFVGFIEKWLIN